MVSISLIVLQIHNSYVNNYLYIICFNYMHIYKCIPPSPYNITRMFMILEYILLHQNLRNSRDLQVRIRFLLLSDHFPIGWSCSLVSQVNYLGIYKGLHLCQILGAMKSWTSWSKFLNSETLRRWVYWKTTFSVSLRVCCIERWPIIFDFAIPTEVCCFPLLGVIKRI